MGLIKELKTYIIETSGGIEFEDFFSSHTSSDEGFTQHIHHSIPSYNEMEKSSADAIVSMYSKAKVLDIGASEGTWGKYISKRSNGKVVSHNLDPNEDMKATFDEDPVDGAEFIQQPFGSDYGDMEAYSPRDEYDVVRESMTFQFISTDRESQYKLAKEALKSDGIFITNSKVFQLDDDEYERYEKVKDAYKRQYFSDQEIEKKAKEILPNMSKYMVDIMTTVEALEKHFKYVVQYWVSGNFTGFVAGDDANKIDVFLSKMPEVDGYPNSVEGKLVDIGTAMAVA